MRHILRGSTVVAAAVVIGLSLSARDASACTCSIGASLPCSLGPATVAFVGTVLSVAEDGPDTVFGSTTRFVFQVTESFAGVTAETMVTVRSNTSSCGVHFQVGQAYLVTTGLAHDQTISVSVCGSYTAGANSAAAEIAILRGLRDGASGAVIYGTVSEFREPQPHNRSTDPELYPNLPGVRVTVSGAGVYRETITDADGAFSVAGLPPGEYRVVPRVARPLLVLTHSESLHDRLEDPERVALDQCPAHVTFVASQWGQLTRGAPPAAPAEGCDTEPAARSHTSDAPATIKFDNGTYETVKLYWLDFSGQRVPYGTLAPGRALKQETYLTHPWIVTAEDGRCLGIFQPAGPRSVAYLDN